MRKPLETLKKVSAVIRRSIACIQRKLKRKTTIPENDNFNHLLYYSLYYEDFLPIFANKLIQEYNYAKKYNLNAGKYFLVNLQRLSEYLKLDKQVIICVLYHMEESNLLYYQDSGIKNTKLICLEEDMLITYFPECELKKEDFFEYLQNLKTEEKNLFFDYSPMYKKEPKNIHSWDKKLENKYKSTEQILSFADTTNELRLFIKKNMKNANKIPLATYAYCNSTFMSSDIDRYFILTNKNIQEKIYNCINAYDFEPTKLIKLIDKLCWQTDEVEIL